MSTVHLDNRRQQCEERRTHVYDALVHDQNVDFLNKDNNTIKYKDIFNYFSKILIFLCTQEPKSCGRNRVTLQSFERLYVLCLFLNHIVCFDDNICIFIVKQRCVSLLLKSYCIVLYGIDLKLFTEGALTTCCGRPFQCGTMR